MRKFALAVLAAAALAAVAGAQGPRGGGFGPQTPYTLVTRKDVSKELKVTEDQASKIRLAQDDMRQKMMQAFQDSNGDMAAAFKAMAPINVEFSTNVKGILTADQFKRLLEIYIQRAGTMSVTDTDVQKTISLTDDQVKKLADLQTQAQEANGALIAKARSGELDRDQMGPLMQKNNDLLKTKVEGVLTDANKAALKTAGGDAFTFDPDEPFGGFGRPPGGGGGGGGGGGN